MIAAIRGWLLSVVAVSLLLSLAQSLVPEGSVRRALSLTGGLLLLLAMLQPLSHLDLAGLRPDFSGLAQEVSRRQSELERQSDSALAARIAQRTEAYISDKAGELGIVCSPRVTVKAGEDGVPLPWSAVLRGTPSAVLADVIAEDLGIPKERQKWVIS
jgi:hypothetical protein